MTEEAPSLNKTAFSATAHCLTGCSIGEVLGMTVGILLGWGNLAVIPLAIGFAFMFGYSLTLFPLVKSRVGLSKAMRLALLSDTASITTMEIVDNAMMVLLPGAMAAGLLSWQFWWSLALSLVIAGVAAFPVNRRLIARGKGHAIIH